jgi:hypothetical protein
MCRARHEGVSSAPHARETAHQFFPDGELIFERVLTEYVELISFGPSGSPPGSGKQTRA